jgi:ATP-dependent Clp protease, protease subunit
MSIENVAPVGNATDASVTVSLTPPTWIAPTRFVSFLHQVDPASVRALIQTVTRVIQEEPVKSLGLLVSTPGGDVDSGVLLFNTLRALPVELTTYNIGNVDSIGNVV